jgi:D-alanyl-D-alanine carboxypeptidase (penicillin-binding protein 5/6)
MTHAGHRTRNGRNLAYRTFLAALFGLCSFLAPAAIHAAQTPPPPVLAAGAWLLVDHDSGQVLAEHDADRALAPASLAKLMTAYLLFERLKAGNLKLDDAVTVSANAAGRNALKLFLRAGQQARVEDLLKGMLVRSANDATVALVEHVAGSEAAFVEEMNRKAQAFGLSNTVYTNATGLDQPGQTSTARDITRLAGLLLRDFPGQSALFAVKEFTYNEIKQYNRNALLWRDASVDGMKTGRTRAAGYCLVATARRGTMRLVATVLGAADEAGRVDGAQRLLDHGFRHFETRLLYAAEAPAAKVRVWMGSESVLPLGVERNLYLTLARGLHEKLRARLTVKELQYAPVRRGQRVGTLALDVDGRPYAEYPLVALAEVGTGNFFQRVFDRIQLWLQ